MLLMLILPERSHAQILSRGDLFGPGAPPPMIGVEAAFGKHAQQGTFSANCGCTFENGSGAGFMGAAFFELPINYEWAIGLKLGADWKNTLSTANVLEQAIVQGVVSGTLDTIAAMSLDRISAVSTTYFNVLPYAQYQFFRMGPFVQAGLQVGFLMSNHFTQQRELTQTSFTTISGGHIDNLRFQNGTVDATIDDTLISGVSGMRLGLVLSAGYNVQVSERSVFAPMVSYDFPLTAIRTTNASGWKIASLYASAELKFRLE